MEYLVRTIYDTRERDVKEWLAHVALAVARATLQWLRQPATRHVLYDYPQYTVRSTTTTAILLAVVEVGVGEQERHKA